MAANDAPWGPLDSALPKGGPPGPAAGRTIRAPRVLVLEDDPLWARSYARQLDAAGYQAALVSSLAECTRLLITSEHVFDVAVLDLDLPDGCGADVVHPLLARDPLCKSVVVTGWEDGPGARDLVKMGAHSYVRKPPNPRAFLLAISAALEATLAWRRAMGQSLRGDQPGPTSYADAAQEWTAAEDRPLAFDIKNAIARLERLGTLTPAQTITASRLLWGDTDKEIAAYLGRAERTVKHHVAEILRKTGARNRAGLLRVLLEDAGLRDPALPSDEPPGD